MKNGNAKAVLLELLDDPEVRNKIGGIAANPRDFTPEEERETEDAFGWLRDLIAKEAAAHE